MTVCWCFQLEAFHQEVFFISQKMRFIPRGSGPDLSSIPPDHTMQTLWTSTTTKKERPLPMISMETAGKQSHVKILISA